MRLTIPGCIRSKKNSKRIVKAGPYYRLIPSKAYKKWEESFRQTLAAYCAKHRIRPTDKPVAVTAGFYYKGPEPDLSGCLESLADACEKLLWNNDKQIISWDGSRKIHDVRNPRVEFEWKEVQMDYGEVTDCG